MSDPTVIVTEPVTELVEAPADGRVTLVDPPPQIIVDAGGAITIAEASPPQLVAVAEPSVVVTTEPTSTLLEVGISGPQGPPGLVWRGAWSAVVQYQPGDAVAYGGGSYIAVTVNTDSVPAAPSADWDVLAQAGAAGSAPQAYAHTQSVPQTSWTIDHGLGYAPNVTIVNTLGDVVDGDVSYPSLTRVVLTFSAAFSGTAYLS